MASKSVSRTISTVSAATAVSLYQANPSMAPVIVQDSTYNIGKYLDGLETLARAGKVASLSLTDTTTMTISGSQFTNDGTIIALLPVRAMLVVRQAKVAQAPALQADARVTSFAVSDTAAAVSAALDALNADSRLTAIALTDTARITMTYAQMRADSYVLGRLPSSALYQVSGVSVSNAAAVSANAKVGGFGVVDTAAAVTTLPALAKLTSAEVRDTAAAISARLDALATVAGVSLLTPTDTTVLAVTAAQYSKLGALLGRLAAGDTLAVRGVAAADATAVAAGPRVSSVTVADTLAHIGTSLDALEVLTEAGKLTSIVVTDTGQTLVLDPAKFASDQQALALMSGNYTVQVLVAPPTASPPLRAPVINLVWDASVANAPAGFQAAVQYAASFYDQLITSPVSINISVGYGEARNTTLGSGLLGEAYVTSAVSRTFSQFRADLTAHNTSADITTALAAMTDPGDGKSVFVPGAEAKALGLVSANDTKLDGAIGFALDPTGSLFTYDPAARAVPGKVDFIGVAQHEIAHALGRVSYTFTRTAFDLFRYAAPAVRAAPGVSPAYLSIDGGVSNLGNFSATGDAADWGAAIGTDAQNAFLGSGIQFAFGAADITALNVLGYAIDGATAMATATQGSVSAVTTTGSGAALAPGENGGGDTWAAIMAAFSGHDRDWGMPPVPGADHAPQHDWGGIGGRTDLWAAIPPVPHWVDRG